MSDNFSIDDYDIRDDDKEIYFSIYAPIFDDKYFSDSDKLKYVDNRVFYEWGSPHDNSNKAFENFASQEKYKANSADLELAAFYDEELISGLKKAVDLKDIEYYVEIGPGGGRFSQILKKVAGNHIKGMVYYSINSHNSTYYPWEESMKKRMYKVLNNFVFHGPALKLRTFTDIQVYDYIERVLKVMEATKIKESKKSEWDDHVEKIKHIGREALYPNDILSGFKKKNTIYCIFGQTVCNLDMPNLVRTLKRTQIHNSSYLMAGYPLFPERGSNKYDEAVKKTLASYGFYDFESNDNPFQDYGTYLAKYRLLKGAFEFMGFDTDTLEPLIRAVEVDGVDSLVFQSGMRVKPGYDLGHKIIDFEGKKQGGFYLPLNHSKRYTNENMFNREIEAGGGNIIWSGVKNGYCIFLAKIT